MPSHPARRTMRTRKRQTPSREYLLGVVLQLSLPLPTIPALGAMGRDVSGRPRSNDSPPEAVAALHAQSMNRSNIFHRCGYHYSHDFFAHRATAD